MDLRTLRVADLMGTGTAGLLWSTSSGQAEAETARYHFLELNGGGKRLAAQLIVASATAGNRMTYHRSPKRSATQPLS
jgi:hypothetical protein